MSRVADNNTKITTAFRQGSACVVDFIMLKNVNLNRFTIEELSDTGVFTRAIWRRQTLFYVATLLLLLKWIT